MSDARRRQIQNKKKKKKKKSNPLSPVYFCDAPACVKITEEDDKKSCSNCMCFYYCNVECQKKHWPTHKLMCGKKASPEMKKKLANYMEARDAAEAIYQKVKEGNYTTVIHEKGDVPAAIFSTIAQKSNVLNWRQYLKNPLFTTSAYAAFGNLATKIRAAQNDACPDKLYAIVVIFDRLKDGQNNEAVIRLFTAEEFGDTMDAPDGKVIKQVIRYKRR